MAAPYYLLVALDADDARSLATTASGHMGQASWQYVSEPRRLTGAGRGCRVLVSARAGLRKDWPEMAAALEVAAQRGAEVSHGW